MFLPEEYLTSRGGTQSLMNLNIMDYLTVNDYYEWIIDDSHKYRPDKIAKDLLGEEKYYIFIFWINSIETLDDLDSGLTIKIPTKTFIQRYRDEMKLIRGIS